MREIKFRGQRTDNGKWVYGHLLKNSQGSFIVCHDFNVLSDGESCIRYVHPNKQIQLYEIIPETIGQYIGFKDKNKKEIYEGDRWVVWNKMRDGYLFDIIIDINCSKFMLDGYRAEQGEVIDNIYETLDLRREEDGRM